MVKILSPTTETVEYPRPMPFAFHASGGPFSGHCLSRLLSMETLSRFGPRHWGQSDGEAPPSLRAGGAATAAAARTVVAKAAAIRGVVFIGVPLGVMA